MRIFVSLAAAMVLAGAADAAIIFSTQAGAPDAGPPANETIVEDFDNPTAAGYSWAGDIVTETGSHWYAATPAGNGSRYGYVSTRDGGATATLFTPKVSSISFYWGSIDTYNHVDILGAGGSVLFTLSGSAIPPSDGDWFSGATNQRVSFTRTSGPHIEGVRFRTDWIAFEVDDIATSGAVPEPATWAFMIAGFGMVGSAARRRRRQSVLVSA